MVWRSATRFLLLPLLGAAIALAGCAGPIETRYGSAGVVPDARLAVAILQPPMPENADGGAGATTLAQARDAVVAALGRRGIAVAPDSADRLEIAITARPASSGVAVIGGTALSPAKKQRLLQSCHDTTFRLALAFYAGTDPVAASRSWAEESHCHGTLAQSLPALADRAVAALLTGEAGSVDRSGVD
jgi:hypothetical protein